MKAGNPSVRWKARKTNAELANFGRGHARARYRNAGALRSDGHGQFMRQRTPDVGFGQFSTAIMHHRIGGAPKQPCSSERHCDQQARTCAPRTEF